MGPVTDLVPSPAPAVFQPALLTPTPKAAERVLEFFTAQIDNHHTRKAYLNATRRFAAWCDVKVSTNSPTCIRSTSPPSSIDGIMEWFHLSQ